MNLTEVQAEGVKVQAGSDGFVPMETPSARTPPPELRPQAELVTAVRSGAIGWAGVARASSSSVRGPGNRAPGR